YSAFAYEVPEGGRQKVLTDLQVRVPTGGYYARIVPRSGLASNHGIQIGAGVVDEDYTGIIWVILFNMGSEVFSIKEGDRIAQLICEKIGLPQVEEVDALDPTECGSGVNGSTG
ncbi:DUT protein, partial [Polyodon spathula]|nr:DUT protein [Polyodon spathula]